MTVSEQIKIIAQQLGFDDCGICSAEVDTSEFEKFSLWLSKGYNYKLEYMANNVDLRRNPSLLVENAKSVISVILSYNLSDEAMNCAFRIAKYAYVNDYHQTVKSKLYLLLDGIKKIMPEMNARCFVDSAPVLERYFAQKAGLGFIGRNRCLISPKFGSWIFIGEIICDAELDYDAPNTDSCMNCGKCLESCPTKALSEEGIDCSKCISFHTIESKDDLPEEISSAEPKTVFGCDECQICCPHNRNIIAKDGKIIDEIKNFNPAEILAMSNHQFEKKFRNTSLLRAGRKKILKNCGL